MSASPILPIEATAALLRPELQAMPATTQRSTTSFADMLSHGIEQVQTQVDEADRLSRAFILDDSIPVHQVTFALEQARLSMEMMLQVRGRLVEGFQQLMNMQL
jgi:flagellar hook-basal body complex protein FliE